MRKISMYLDQEEAERLARLARQEGCSRAEIIRRALESYLLVASRDRQFALASGFARIDDDPRPLSQIPKDERLSGFGR